MVGAGIGGLTCAHRLASRGFSVRVHEAADQVGGRMASRWKHDLLFDTGANFLAESYRATRALAAEVGVELSTPGPVRHVYLRQGQYHKMNMSSLRDILEFDGLSLMDRFRAAWLGLRLRFKHSDLDFFELANLPESLIDGSAYDFAVEQAGRDFADYIVDAFTSCMMFHRSDELSRGAMISLMHMMVDPRWSFQIMYCKEGMLTLPLALSRGIELCTGDPVIRVRRIHDRVWLRSSRTGTEYDAVVLAVPAPVARAMIEDALPEEQSMLEAVRYSSTMNVSLVVPNVLPPAHHCFYVPFRESPLISEFTNEAFKGGAWQRGIETTVNVGLHEGAARRLMSASDGTVIDEVIQELAKVASPLGLTGASMVAHDLERWPMAIPKYDSDLIRAVKRFQQAGQGRGAVFLCGDYLAAPWVEGTVRCGLRVAQEVEEHLARTQTARDQAARKQASPVSSA